MVANEHFQIRNLLWDELKLNVPASEEVELRSALGSHLIEGNEDLRQELVVLVDILSDFQQQNDDIRDALAKRVHLPEPPGRYLLIGKLKLLAGDMHDYSTSGVIESSETAEMLQYVFSTVDRSNSYTFQLPMTRKESDIQYGQRTGDQADSITIRQGTRNGKTELTTCSPRPVSRGSTRSISSITAMFESSELLRGINLDGLDGITEDLQKALEEERLLLLDDIDFIHGCLEMEKDLIDDDRRKVDAAKPPPSLQRLHLFQKTLEKTMQDQETLERMESVISKAHNSSQVRNTLIPVHQSDLPMRMHTDSTRHPTHSPLSSLPSTSKPRTASATRVLKIRQVVQENRDESYLS